ncbi:MAG: hypothetical protein HKN82_02580, partial [Akkermansiaceae bacterium]|nr:hypothetical protein [Akkermansiaceae bacterium]
IVADRDFVFIGVNTILHNAELTGDSAAEVTRRFAAELGRKAMVIGPAPQPVGHIDLVLAPLGGRRVALADPGWGARLVRDLVARDPEAATAFEQECIDGFFGRKGIKGLLDKDGRPIDPPDILGHTRTAAAHCAGLAADFDALATDLEDIGYEVLRIPFLGPAPEDEVRPAPDAPDGEVPLPGPRFPTLTYNNVILSGRDTVFLARYGLGPLDEAAAGAWRAAGYEVRPVEAMTTSAMYGGSLRCCVKVLERSSASPRNE